MPGAKEWPLLVSTLTDRAAKVAPNELIVTKTSDGYHRQTFSEHQERSEALVAAREAQVDPTARTGPPRPVEVPMSPPGSKDMCNLPAELLDLL